MKKLDGFRDFMQTKMEISIFNDLLQSNAEAVLILCDGTDASGKVTENLQYELKFRPLKPGEELPDTLLEKVAILLVFSPEYRDRIYTHSRIKGLGNTIPAKPLHKISQRNFIKNKTLYTMLCEHQVMEIKLLNGMVLKGLVAGFNPYEIRLSLKGGVPVVVLRHGILSAQTKTGRSLLQVDQNKLKDWKKSQMYVETT